MYGILRAKKKKKSDCHSLQGIKQRGLLAFFVPILQKARNILFLFFPSGSFQGLEKHCIGKSYERHLLECFFCIEVGMGEAQTLEQADKINSALL